MRRIYVDSNVFISYWDHEYGRKISDFLEYYSEELFRRTLACEFKLVVSDLVLFEIKRVMNLSGDVLDVFLNEYKKVGKLEILEISEDLWEEAREIARSGKTHVTDAAHTLAAKRTNADLVTWNLKDFQNLDLKVTSPRYL